MTPRVSICVPNLNMRPFLPDRFESIFNQTLQDWELFVYDSHSDDGAWEYLEDLAARQPRLRLAQGPRKGPYPAWNECLRQTSAEFVYIATSDDTMALDCLEKLATALERNRDCDLAHCPLIVIDRDGVPGAQPSWPESTVFWAGNEEALDRAHIRRAPYDGLLHLMGYQVFFSITQLLIRRSLFSRIGDFSSRWGSVSDFNWEMKAGLVANTVHVPGTWASWRVHPAQATASVDARSLQRDRYFDEMVDDAIQSCQAYLSPPVAARLRSDWLDDFRTLRSYYAALRRRGISRRRLYQFGEYFSGNAAIRAEMFRRAFSRKNWYEFAPGQIRTWLESTGIEPLITLMPEPIRLQTNPK